MGNPGSCTYRRVLGICRAATVDHDALHRSNRGYRCSAPSPRSLSHGGRSPRYRRSSVNGRLQRRREKASETWEAARTRRTRSHGNRTSGRSPLERDPVP
jgi:hypothetical protein